MLSLHSPQQSERDKWWAESEKKDQSTKKTINHIADVIHNVNQLLEIDRFIIFVFILFL